MSTLGIEPTSSPLIGSCDERGVHFLTPERAPSFNALRENMLTALQTALDSAG